MRSDGINKCIKLKIGDLVTLNKLRLIVFFINKNIWGQKLTGQRSVTAQCEYVCDCQIARKY